MVMRVVSDVRRQEREHRKARFNAALRFSELLKTQKKRSLAAHIVAKEFKKSAAWVYKWWHVLEEKGPELANFESGKPIPKKHGRRVPALTAIFIRSCEVLRIRRPDIIARLRGMGLRHGRAGIEAVLAKEASEAEKDLARRLYDVVADRREFKSKKWEHIYGYLDSDRDWPGHTGGDITKATATAFVDFLPAQAKARGPWALLPPGKGDH